MTLTSRIPAVRAALGEAMDETASQAAAAAKRVRDARCPVDTSALLRSGVVQQTGAGRFQLREGDGLPDARASYTEYGTSRQAAQPHMTPAAAEAERVLPIAAAAALRKAIR